MREVWQADDPGSQNQTFSAIGEEAKGEGQEVLLSGMWHTTDRISLHTSRDGKYRIHCVNETRTSGGRPAP